jgi:hypothetical protein
MGRSGARLTLAFLVVVCAIVFASAGGAGPRTAEATFEAFPGPVEVTYGELIAYKGTFTTQSDSTLTQVRFRQTIPAVGSQPATIDSSTCPSTPTTRTTSTGTEWICYFGQVPAGTPTLELTVVWRVPASGPSPCLDCLVSTGRWTVKEGVNDTTDPNDVFGLTETKATLLGAGEATQGALRAGGYETDSTSCAVLTAPGNLRTNDVVSLANPVSSKFCLPPFTIPPGNKNLGFASTITETLGDARGSVVCIAQLGTNCGPGHLDAVFLPPYVTHIFRVADAALDNDRIEEIRHNGEILPSCEDEPDNLNGCVVDILKPKGNQNPKVWVLIVTSPTNGPYGW